MTARKMLVFLAASASALCLGGGFAAAGLWLGAAAGIASFAGWLAAWRWRKEGLLTGMLGCAAVLAAVGILAGALPELLIPGAAFALAAWDLTAFDRSLDGPEPTPLVGLLEKKHLLNLGLGLLIGILAALAGRAVHLRIPFLDMLALIALAVFCLDRVLQAISGSENQNF